MPVLRLTCVLVSLGLTACSAGPLTSGGEASDTDASGSGVTGQTEESGAESSAETGEAGEAGETGGVSCPADYSTATTFAIDIAAWNVEFVHDEAQVVDCVTTQAEVQGLGLVMEFDCGASGSAQITVGGLGVIDPPMMVGAPVELEMLGYHFGGFWDEPDVPRDLGFSAEEFVVRDDGGLLVGAMSGPGIRDAWAPLAINTVSPCGVPPDTEDYEGALELSEGAMATSFNPGERGEWTTAAGDTYVIDVGRVTNYSCCEAQWQVDAVFARRP